MLACRPVHGQRNPKPPVAAGGGPPDMSAAAEMAMAEFQRNPYPIYARWRVDHPVFEAEPGHWLVTTYADASGILRDARFGACRPTLGGPGRDGRHLDQLREIAYRWVLFENPPVHGRLSALLHHAFAVDFVAGLRERVEGVADSILEECVERRSFDLIGDLAAPFSVLVLADALGLPREDGARFRRWSAQIAPLLDGTLRSSHLDAAAQAVGETVEYLRPIVRDRRANPGEDGISRLAAVREPGGAPSLEELLSTCVFVLTAGHETTGTLLGNGVVALLENPGELERLRDDPSLGVRAVEEFLRYDSPVQATSRVPIGDVDWAGTTFPAGTVVNVLLGSANRDPAQFVDPDRLDVGRIRNPHLAFSGGIHTCPGARLARFEARIVIERLVRGLPNLALGPGEPVRRPGTVLRGYRSIPVHS